jgi:hypothetical protein
VLEVVHEGEEQIGHECRRNADDCSEPDEGEVRRAVRFLGVGDG